MRLAAGRAHSDYHWFLRDRVEIAEEYIDARPNQFARGRTMDDDLEASYRVFHGVFACHQAACLTTPSAGAEFPGRNHSVGDTVEAGEPGAPEGPMSAKPATPASVILEVIARTCGRPVRRGQALGSDLLPNDDDLLELRAALELALECDFEIDGGITVSDLFDAIIAQSKAA